jgi:hypothetical protein
LLFLTLPVADVRRILSDRLLARLADSTPFLHRTNQALLETYNLAVTVSMQPWTPPLPSKPVLTTLQIGIIAGCGAAFVLFAFFFGKWVWFKYIWKPRAITPAEATLRDTMSFLKRAEKAGGQCAWTGE